ncbi:MAG: hypothetical protein LBH69_04845 [Methanomassiliicoccaceae archaeon]|jgi:hypothetical protein|nr:hypothetical protein [Methanomassiliicoccaceae archaeon]
MRHLRNYIHLTLANSVKDPEFDGMKERLFRSVEERFDPSFSDETVDDYVFYIKDERRLVRYDRGIKCWYLIADDKLIMNRYDSDSDIFICPEGHVKKWHSDHCYPNRECVLKEYERISEGIRCAAKDQECGTRVLSFPKKKRYGRISLKDYCAGLDEWGKNNFWVMKFSEDHIRYICKEPTTEPLTLREYFRLCRLYYLTDTSISAAIPDDPKEAYLRFSDGRTDNMEDVDQDDPRDLYDWAYRKGKWACRYMGGHPFEIRARTYLNPYFTDGTSGHYELREFIWNYDSAVELCKEPNVMLSGRKYIADAIRQKGNMRVSPHLGRPHGYPNKEYIQPVHYPELTRKQKLKIVWDELVEARIKTPLSFEEKRFGEE